MTRMSHHRNHHFRHPWIIIYLIINPIYKQQIINITPQIVPIVVVLALCNDRDDKHTRTEKTTDTTTREKKYDNDNDMGYGNRSLQNRVSTRKGRRVCSPPPIDRRLGPESVPTGAFTPPGQVRAHGHLMSSRPDFCFP